MSKILFTYDLNKETNSAKRENLRNAILQAFPACWCRLTTTWIVDTPNSAAQIRDWISQFLDANDELFVADITGVPVAWAGMDERGSTWLAKNLRL